MLEILSRSIARAGGIEVPDDVQIVSATRPGRRSSPNLLGRMAAGFRRWHDRRATYMALAALSDHHLKDIGLHRGMLDRAADDLAHIRFANDNRPNWRVGRIPANDNLSPDRSEAGCV